MEQQSGFRRHSPYIAFGLMLLILVFAPFLAYPIVVIQIMCFALFACSFNLLAGYGGIFSFGHALFFGWSAYVCGHLAKVGAFQIPFWSGEWHWLTVQLPPLSPELAILGGTTAAALLGLIVGALAIRRRGIYFSMITLALAQMMYFLALRAGFTGGEDGLQGIPRGAFLGIFDLSDMTTLYVFVLVIFLIGFGFIYRVTHSPFGEVLKVIRENEARAISLGYKTQQVKLLAFVLSSALAGLAGSTKAIVFQLATLTDVAWHMSGEVVLMALIGGVGTIFGPVVGASIVIIMQNYFTALGEWVTVVQGGIFVFCVLMFRRGVVGEITRIAQIRL